MQGTSFDIDENAFAELEEYLASVRKHFTKYRDGEEIITDIEIRIAEKAVKLAAGKTLSKSQLKKIIAEIGNVDEMDNQSLHELSFSEQINYRLSNFKLLRDTTNQTVAGVCAGLGMYFGLDPVIFRLAFGVVAILGVVLGEPVTALAVCAYILFWVAMPAAKTPAQRIEMKGAPVTLSNISKEIAQSKQHVSKNPGPIAVAANQVQEIVGVLLQLVVKGFKLASRAIGLIISLFALGTLFVSLFGLLSLLAKPNYLSDRLPQVVNDEHYQLLVGMGFLAIVLPALLGLQVGISLLIKRNTFKTLPTLAVVGLIVVIASSFAALSLTKYTEFSTAIRNNASNYEITQKEIKLTDVKALMIRGRYNIVLTNQAKNTLVVKANKYLIDQLGVNHDGNVLRISQNQNLFYVPELANSKIHVEINKNDFADLSISYADSFTAQTQVKANQLTINGTITNKNLDVITDRLSMSIYSDTGLTISGRADRAELVFSGGDRLDASNLITKKMQAVVHSDSEILVNASEEFSGYAYGEDSQISYVDHVGLEVVKIGNVSKLIEK